MKTPGKRRRGEGANGAKGRRGEGEKGRMGEGEKGRRGEGEKGRRGEGEKGRRGEGEKGIYQETNGQDVHKPTPRTGETNKANKNCHICDWSVS